MRSMRHHWFSAAVIAIMVLAPGWSQAADIAIGIQATAGDAQKYQALQTYLAKKGVPVVFRAAPDYKSAADMFSSGAVDAMFSGSGVSGVMIIKGLGTPAVRPVNQEGFSTYAAAIVAPKGGARFTGSPDYFNGKRVIFSALASAGEVYFRSLGKSSPKEIMKAANHAAALDALGRGAADVAVVKNHVWNKEQGKYPQLELVYEDRGQNPDGTLMISKKMDAEAFRKLSAALLGIKDDPSQEAAAAKQSLKIREYIKTTDVDFKYTVGMLQKAGVTKDFAFQF